MKILTTHEFLIRKTALLLEQGFTKKAKQASSLFKNIFIFFNLVSYEYFKCGVLKNSVCILLQ